MYKLELLYDMVAMGYCMGFVFFFYIGADVRNVKQEDAGRVLADHLRVIMQEMKVANGLKAVGYGTEHIPQLVKGTVPQVRYRWTKPGDEIPSARFALETLPILSCNI